MRLGVVHFSQKYLTIKAAFGFWGGKFENLRGIKISSTFAKFPMQ